MLRVVGLRACLAVASRVSQLLQGCDCHQTLPMCCHLADRICIMSTLTLTVILDEQPARPDYQLTVASGLHQLSAKGHLICQAGTCWMRLKMANSRTKCSLRVWLLSGMSFCLQCLSRHNLPVDDCTVAHFRSSYCISVALCMQDLAADLKLKRLWTLVLCMGSGVVCLQQLAEELRF